MTVLEKETFGSLDETAIALGGQPCWYQLGEGRFKSTLERRVVEGIRFTRFRMTQSILMLTQTAAGYCTLLTQLGSGKFFNFGRELKRDILISTGRLQHVVRIPAHCNMLLVEMPMQVVETAGRSNILSQPLPESGAMCVSLERLEFWHRLRECADSLGDEQNEIDLDLQFLTPFFAAVQGEPKLDELCKLLVDRRKTIRLAQKYIEDQFPKGVSVRSLCEHLGIPERTVRFQFEEVYGMPPSRFSKLHRLMAANRLLQHANTGGITVSQVASRCGFSHVSHFTQAYRRQFGVLPSHSLNASFAEPLDRAESFRPSA